MKVNMKKIESLMILQGVNVTELMQAAGLERAGAIHQGLVDDNERFTASAGTYGKGRIKEILAAQKKKQPAGVGAPAGCKG